jgi:hypothetical protein
MGDEKRLTGRSFSLSCWRFALGMGRSGLTPGQRFRVPVEIDPNVAPRRSTVQYQSERHRSVLVDTIRLDEDVIPMHRFAHSHIAAIIPLGRQNDDFACRYEPSVLSCVHSTVGAILSLNFYRGGVLLCAPSDNIYIYIIIYIYTRA